MKKILISVENLDQYVYNNNVYCNKDIIITAGAKDLCASRGIEIKYGQAPSLASSYYNVNQTTSCCASSNTLKACCSDTNVKSEENALKNMIVDYARPNDSTCCVKKGDPFERVLINLAIMIQENLGITDMKKLRDMSLQLAKTIKENL